MKRLEGLSMILVVLLAAKWANLLPISVEWDRLLGFMLILSYLLNIDQARSPITHIVAGPVPRRNWSKMVALSKARVNHESVVVHLKSGEFKSGYVVKNSYTTGAFVLQKEPGGKCHYYQADDIDEVIVSAEAESALINIDEGMTLPTATAESTT